jgi:hypothetical protein
MERAPSVHEEPKKRPTVAEAKIILWDELHGVIKDIACGQREAGVSDDLGTPMTFLPGMDRKEVVNT